jgi:cell division protein FtsW
VVKYLGFEMRAHNHGEGGVLALLALSQQQGSTPPRARYVAFLVALAGTAFLIFGEAYRRTRFVDAFLNPWNDPDGAGFQLIQGMIALGRAGEPGSASVRAARSGTTCPTPTSSSRSSARARAARALFVLAMFAVLCSPGSASRSPPRTPSDASAAGITRWIGLQTIINLGAVPG